VTRRAFGQTIGSSSNNAAKRSVRKCSGNAPGPRPSMRILWL
jgi:hypothetical protein